MTSQIKVLVLFTIVVGAIVLRFSGFHVSVDSRLLGYLGWFAALLLMPVVYLIYRAYDSQRNMLRDRQRRLDDTEALHLRTIAELATAIGAKDKNTHDPLLRVRSYVSEIGKSLRLSDLELQALLAAAYLRDIGKLAVPEHIINKPGKLTQEEFEKIKIHPIVGTDILERVRFPYPVVPIVRSHHEHWDGRGYPDGLKGEEIPMGARILAVVDCFDALVSDRPYRKAMSLDEAMLWVKGKAGTKFDPVVVDVLAEHYLELEELVRQQGKALPSLTEDLAIWHGAAPGTGFEQENEEHEFDRTEGCLPVSAEGGQSAARCESLDLIAAAAQEAQHIFEMSQMLGSSLSPSETSAVMATRLRHLIPFHCFALYLKHKDMLSAQYIDGERASYLLPPVIRMGEGLLGKVAQSGLPVLTGNPGWQADDPGNGEHGVRFSSALAVPLFDLAGAIFGVLSIYAKEPNAFSRDHLRILQAVESKFSLSLENALRFRKTQADAGIDFLTQLPNVRKFFIDMEEELGRARSKGGELSLVVCDLNSFKAINDRHGHVAGNRLLRAVSDRFRECCRAGGTVARMGGDEFVFLFAGLDQQGCRLQLERIQQAVRLAGKQIGLEIEASASVGAASYPADGNVIEELLSAADRRMYFDKRCHYELAAKGSQSSPPVAAPALA